MRRRVTLLALLAVILSVSVRIPVFAGELSDIYRNKDKVSIMGDLKIDRKTDGDVVVIIGKADIQSEVDGDVVVIFGDIDINSRVMGDVVAVMGTAKLSDGAEIGKDVVSIGTIEKSPRARIMGQEVTISMKPMAFAGTISSILIILSTFFIIILGIIIIALFRERIQHISHAIDTRIFRKFVMGLLGIVLMTILMPFLAITIVAPMLYLGMIVISIVMVSVLIGKLIVKQLKSEVNEYIEFIVGLSAITLVKIIVMLLSTQIGFGFSMLIYVIVAVILNALGVGILIDSRFGNSVPADPHGIHPGREFFQATEDKPGSESDSLDGEMDNEK